jgi:hypothetical protein
MQQYQDTALVQNSTVQSILPVVGGTVQVYNKGTLVLASIFSDNGITPVDQVANPIITDSNGRFDFYAANGRYDYTITAPGISTITVHDTLLEDLAGLFAIGTLVTASAANTTNNLTTATPANLVSINLPVGTWDIEGVAEFVPASTTSLSAIQVGISLHSTPTFDGLGTYSRQIYPAAFVPNTLVPVDVVTPTLRIVVTVPNTSVYLVGIATFGTSTLTAGGSIRATLVTN